MKRLDEHGFNCVDAGMMLPDGQRALSATPVEGGDIFTVKPEDKERFREFFSIPDVYTMTENTAFPHVKAHKDFDRQQHYLANEFLVVDGFTLALMVSQSSIPGSLISLKMYVISFE